MPPRGQRQETQQRQQQRQAAGSDNNNSNNHDANSILRVTHCRNSNTLLFVDVLESARSAAERKFQNKMKDHAIMRQCFTDAVKEIHKVQEEGLDFLDGESDDEGDGDESEAAFAAQVIRRMETDDIDEDGVIREVAERHGLNLLTVVGMPPRPPAPAPSPASSTAADSGAEAAVSGPTSGAYVLHAHDFVDAQALRANRQSTAVTGGGRGRGRGGGGRGGQQTRLRAICGEPFYCTLALSNRDHAQQSNNNNSISAEDERIRTESVLKTVPPEFLASYVRVVRSASEKLLPLQHSESAAAAVGASPHPTGAADPLSSVFNERTCARLRRDPALLPLLYVLLEQQSKARSASSHGQTQKRVALEIVSIFPCNAWDDPADVHSEDEDNEGPLEWRERMRKEKRKAAERAAGAAATSWFEDEEDQDAGAGNAAENVTWADEGEQALLRGSILDRPVAASISALMHRLATDEHETGLSGKELRRREAAESTPWFRDARAGLGCSVFRVHGDLEPPPHHQQVDAASAKAKALRISRMTGDILYEGGVPSATMKALQQQQQRRAEAEANGASSSAAPATESICDLDPSVKDRAAKIRDPAQRAQFLRRETRRRQRADDHLQFNIVRRRHPDSMNVVVAVRIVDESGAAASTNDEERVRLPLDNFRLVFPDVVLAFLLQHTRVLPRSDPLEPEEAS